jgi:[ribosomal protein S5]-alanine N-acetyltransferase
MQQMTPPPTSHSGPDTTAAGGIKRSHHFLTGERVYLREVRLSDVDDNYYRWLNDPEITQYLEIRYLPHSLGNIQAYVTAMDGKVDEIFLAICLRENDRHIGNIKLGPINALHGAADISLLIGEKDCWGQGYATEAIRLCCQFAFGVRNLRKLNAGVYASNLGSKRAFEKAGFREEGRLRGQGLVRGRPEDHVLLGMLTSEFITEPRT